MGCFLGSKKSCNRLAKGLMIMMHEADAFKFDSLGSATCGRALSCAIVVAFHLTNAGKKSLQF